ncbi:hypothetical protein SERLA73DRAFT_113095 [Serpula lacrymans var. lacrymans S7.3]|uniref:SAC domain-containing protein n=2 Tax=Serpula lacrymans var. lacrymans TaxID=341189 RepID=F8Q7H4_SERL3|nr:uncharacterized protein SERLADRAFT_452182 [Serpula lacrymans var. lacrymans S7.9]EGN95512.1 hypothetical protein SERLA73DRAFT_113095 [Serpula lacrymans var. lacrymans S7.3]EGO21039.1 hypothetical protein SERLADRAFT_452182 [Serpula lacrymans var. lacrymans S7.9]
MKRFFSKPSSLKSPTHSPSRSQTVSPPPSIQVPTSTQAGIAHTTGLQPSFVVPPVPHPHPHEYIALLVSNDGLLMRPHAPGLKHPGAHVRIAWGKQVKVEEVSGDGEDPSRDWSESTIIYGIVGILELFSASYLLVITSRSGIGSLFDDNHAVYGVKSVTAIPLVQDRARTALNTMASRNADANRPSLIPSDTSGRLDTTRSTSSHLNVSSSSEAASPHVKFADEEDVRLVTPLTARFSGESNRSPSPASSGASTPGSEESMSTSPVATTIANRLSFWTRLSKRTSTSAPTMTLDKDDTSGASQSLLEERESLDSIIQGVQGVQSEPEKVIDSIIAATAPPPTSSDEKHSELEDRIVRECIKEFTKGGMYAAYNFDITRSLQHKQEQCVKSHRQDSLLADLNALDKKVGPLDDKVDVLAEPFPMLPLWRRVDRQFWWNEWLSKPFVDAGLHSYVLPIMQGYCQFSKFDLPADPTVRKDEHIAPIDYIIISRRSRDRAGLRYQRRGVDDESRVANFVETETIMRVQRNGISNVFSYVQIRGSIPLFWTQSGYSLKPPPLLSPERTREQNVDALRRHFQRNVPKYGPHTVVNLAESQGKEGAITQAYRSYMKELNYKDARYCEYDFHNETKGMKYENISKLVDNMERVFESQGYFWISNDMLLSKQKGVFRVNCIDCLDRTNVVQSAFARHVMNIHLGAVALLNPSENGRSDTDIIFNDVWANNGDAISRAYAGTSALKGDYTRTGKRDLGGLLNDGVNSLARMYSATFSDWFCQAVIDFMLGYRTISVFSEFLLKLQSTDPRELIRLSKIRAEAIATSVSRVLDEGERLMSGWTVIAPEQLNVKMGDKFEEKVLLLSARALYIISYDYTLEKVKMYTRVPLGDIVKITKGAYILSPLEEASRDPVQNAGFTVSWLHSQQISTRLTSYSYRNRPEDAPASFFATLKSRSSIIKPALPSRGPSSGSGPGLSQIMSQASPVANETNFAAFKVLPVDPTRTRRGSSIGYAEPADDLAGASSCQEVVNLMVDAVKRACDDIGGVHGDFIAEEDVVSVTDAQRMTSVYAKMEYGVKRLLWLGG